MKRHNRHAFFRTDTNVRVIVKNSEKVDVEWRRRAQAQVPNRGAKLFRGYEAHSEGTNTSPAADRQREVRSPREGHAGAGEWISAAETLGEARSDTGHTSSFRLRDPYADQQRTFRVLDHELVAALAGIFADADAGPTGRQHRHLLELGLAARLDVPDQNLARGVSIGNWSRPLPSMSPTRTAIAGRARRPA